MAYLFLLFLVVPIVEIYLLIQIGGQIGAPTTIAIVILTAIVGAALVRIQGFSTLMRAQSQIAQAKMPAAEVMEGIALVVAGALLLTPGFFTDAFGFVLLTPPLRRLIINRIAKRSPVMSQGFNQSRGPDDGNRPSIIDIDHKEIDD
ncbi:MAG: UPF0716 protein FxsA [Saprospiraceae bacterium]|jgi:UPF0716 protein FxsA